MDLLDKINRELIDAAKARDKVRLSAIRMIKAGIINREKEKGALLDEGELLQVLSSLVKKARESIEDFRKGRRDDLVAKEESQLQVILSFMPKQMSREEVERFLEKKIVDLELDGMKDFGTLMKTAMEELRGRAEGRIVSEIAKAILSS